MFLYKQLPAYCLYRYLIHVVMVWMWAVPDRRMYLNAWSLTAGAERCEMDPQVEVSQVAKSFKGLRGEANP